MVLGWCWPRAHQVTEPSSSQDIAPPGKVLLPPAAAETQRASSPGHSGRGTREGSGGGQPPRPRWQSGTRAAGHGAAVRGGQQASSTFASGRGSAEGCTYGKGAGSCGPEAASALARNGRGRR